MGKLALTGSIAAVGLSFFLSTAEAQNGADYACREAISETLKAGAPKALRNSVLRTCRAAFADTRHRRDPEAACDRQVVKLPEPDRLPAAYTCMTAMSIAYQ